MTRSVLVVAIVAVFASAGCQFGPHDPGEPPRRLPQVSHVVLFKLKNPADAPELIADCDRAFGEWDMVAAYACGTPLDTGRPNVESEYDVGLFLAFCGPADYRAYQDHSRHLALVNKWKPRWEWIRIDDFADPSP